MMTENLLRSKFLQNLIDLRCPSELYLLILCWLLQQFFTSQLISTRLIKSLQAFPLLAAFVSDIFNFDICLKNITKLEKWWEMDYEEYMIQSFTWKCPGFLTIFFEITTIQLLNRN